jgi:hypothetical protein
MVDARLLLESLDDHFDVGLLDPDTGEMDFLSRAQAPAGMASTLRGIFSRVDGHLVVFFRMEDGLAIRIDTSKFQVAPSTSAVLTSRKQGGVMGMGGVVWNRFELVQDGQSLLELEYRAPRRSLPDWIDPTPFVEDEHFDVFRFVVNVLASPERRELVFRTAQEQRRLEAEGARSILDRDDGGR